MSLRNCNIHFKVLTRIDDSYLRNERYLSQTSEGHLTRTIARFMLNISIRCARVKCEEPRRACQKSRWKKKQKVIEREEREKEKER